MPQCATAYCSFARETYHLIDPTHGIHPIIFPEQCTFDQETHSHVSCESQHHHAVTEPADQTLDPDSCKFGLSHTRPLSLIIAAPSFYDLYMHVYARSIHYFYVFYAHVYGCICVHMHMGVYVCCLFKLPYASSPLGFISFYEYMGYITT